MRIHAEIFNININITIIIINLARQFNATAKIDGDCFPRTFFTAETGANL